MTVDYSTRRAKGGMPASSDACRPESARELARLSPDDLPSPSIRWQRSAALVQMLAGFLAEMSAASALVPGLRGAVGTPAATVEYASEYNRREESEHEHDDAVESITSIGPIHLDGLHRA